MSKYSFESLVLATTEDSSSRYSFSYESLSADGMTKQETEIEYSTACMLVDKDALSTFGVYVDIEQWTTSIEVPVYSLKGSMRVRRTTEMNGQSQYELTDKIRLVKDHANDTGAFKHSQEYTVSISKEHFNVRKLMHPTGQIKRRYRVLCDLNGDFKGCYWDIDIFYQKSGELSDCAVVEIEVPKAVDSEMPLPPGFEKMTDIQYKIAKQSVFQITHDNTPV